MVTENTIVATESIVLNTKKPRDCIFCGCNLYPNVSKVFEINRFKVVNGRKRVLANKYMCNVCGTRHHVMTNIDEDTTNVEIEAPEPATSLFRRVFGLFGL